MSEEIDVRKIQENVIVFGTDIKYIKDAITEIKLLLENKYVTKEEFKAHVEASSKALENHIEDDQLVKKIVYGTCTLILVAVVGALITLVIRR